MKDFFVGFNFDTLLALISCVTGIVALFLGGSAYRNCKEIKNSFNDKKKFGDGGTDNSQKAAGDIINNNCDMNAIATLTSANFSTALNEAYKMFELQSEINLKNIIEETEKIIREKKLELSGYTKLDWINVYFESAKNASDIYMQDVWAKVLVGELESPGMFSYKTLDVLKNMSKEDFLLFEKMCSVQVEGVIVRGNAYKNHGLQWMNCLKLCELGLLSLDGTERTWELSGKAIQPMFLNNFTIVLKNKSDSIQKVTFEVFVLTYAARELLNIVEFVYDKSFVEDVVEDIKKYNSDKVEYEIQKVLILNAKVE